MNSFNVHLRYDDTTFEVSFKMESKFNEVNNVLEEIFGQWNGGSGMECDIFNKSHCRSLSVGDYVKVDDQWYRCAGMGWKKVSQDDVDLWFNTMSEIRNNRLPGKSLDDERLLRFFDKRKAQEKLNMPYFS